MYKRNLLQRIIIIITAIIFQVSLFPYKSSAADKITILTDNFYISESNYGKTMDNVVLPYLDSIVSEGSIRGSDNIQLYYRKYIVQNNIANIVIAHDFAEYIDKYDELIYYFTKCGYNVFIMEHRGHGRSHYLGIEDSTQINIDKADYYVSDLKNFINTVVTKHSNGKKKFLFAHSMGAAISTKLMIDNNNIFDAAVLSSPMMDCTTSWLPNTLISLIADSAVLLGYGDNYVPGQGAYSIKQTTDSSGTSSKERFYYYYDFELTNESVQRGGFSLKWFSEMLKITDYITNKKNASKITSPILVLTAENENLFKFSGLKKFMKYTKGSSLIEVKESKHDIYRETDSIQRPAIESILQYFNEKLYAIKREA